LGCQCSHIYASTNILFAINEQLVGPMQFKHAMLWHTHQLLDLKLAIN
jgi:hypothetical protein